jgi:hypothetical protein
MLNYLKNDKNVAPVKDRRLATGAYAFRNEDFNGRKYFPQTLTSLLDSELFSDIDPQYFIKQIPNAYCMNFKRVHGRDSIKFLKNIDI